MQANKRHCARAEVVEDCSSSMAYSAKHMNRREFVQIVRR